MSAPKDQNFRRFLLLIGGLLVGCLAMQLLCKRAQAFDDPPARWDLKRAAVGIAIAGAVYDFDGERAREGAFLPRAWTSYSLGERLSAHAAVDADFDREAAVVRPGLHASLTANPGPEDWRLFLGANYLHYWGDGWGALVADDSSWSLYLQGAKPLVRQADKSVVLWFQGSGEYDVPNHLKTFRVAVSWQAVGGNP